MMRLFVALCAGVALGIAAGVWYGLALFLALASLVVEELEIEEVE